jgi:hypothetical protein
MLLSRFNHLLTLRSFNNEWKKLVDNTHEWLEFHLANEDQKYGTNSWEFQSTFTIWCFQENLKKNSKHSQTTKPSLSNLEDLHIIDLEILCDRLL